MQFEQYLSGIQSFISGEKYNSTLLDHKIVNLFA